MRVKGGGGASDSARNEQSLSLDPSWVGGERDGGREGVISITACFKKFPGRRLAQNHTIINQNQNHNTTQRQQQQQPSVSPSVCHSQWMRRAYFDSMRSPITGPSQPSPSVNYTLLPRSPTSDHTMHHRRPKHRPPPTAPPDRADPTPVALRLPDSAQPGHPCSINQPSQHASLTRQLPHPSEAIPQKPKTYSSRHSTANGMSMA